MRVNVALSIIIVFDNLGKTFLNFTKFLFFSFFSSFFSACLFVVRFSAALLSVLQCACDDQK